MMQAPITPLQSSQDSNADQNLRAQLLAASAVSASQGHHASPDAKSGSAHTASPDAMLDPSMHGNGDSGEDGDDSPNKRGGKRELSTSKRAAQNRAAQRAFRQRKETYIKKLEEQVRDYSNMETSYKQIQAENFQLRDYIIALQSRLIESQGEDSVPAPPVALNPSIQSTAASAVALAHSMENSKRRLEEHQQQGEENFGLVEEGKQPRDKLPWASSNAAATAHVLSEAGSIDVAMR